MKATHYISKPIGWIIRLAVILVFVFPFYWMIITSFKTYDETYIFPPSLWPKQFMWENFSRVWDAAPFGTYTKNSIIITLSIMVIQTIIMVPTAYAFARYKFKFQGILFGIVLVAFMVPGNVTFISTYLMMAKWGWLRTLLPQIIPFGANAFGIFLLRQAFMQTPEEILESARLDSAGEISIMFKIMLPMAKSTMVTALLFSFISHWNSYFWCLVMTDTDALRTIPVGITNLKSIEDTINWELLMAGNVILILPILLIYIFANRKIVTGLSYGGIK